MSLHTLAPFLRPSINLDGNPKVYLYARNTAARNPETINESVKADSVDDLGAIIRYINIRCMGRRHVRADSNGFFSSAFHYLTYN